jgi:hypothetical protein
MEGTINPSDGGTPMVRISSAGNVNWFGGTAYQSFANGAYCFRLEGVANSLQVIGLDCGASSGHLIQNTVTGINLIGTTNPNINFYSDGTNVYFGHIN